jgi:hypothetical protein
MPANRTWVSVLRLLPFAQVASSVPLPAALPLFASGLGGFGLVAQAADRASQLTRQQKGAPAEVSWP